MPREIKNAKIISTSLGGEDHGIFTIYIHLDYGGVCQAFGGWSLDTPDKKSPKEFHKGRVGTAYGMNFIMNVLHTLGVSTWEKLPGTYCRVIAEHHVVHAIGHLLEEKWFNPSEDMERWLGEE